MQIPPSLRAALLALGLLAAGCSGEGAESRSPSSNAPRWYVDVDGPADGDGSSWARASRDLAVVLGKVRPFDEVWVASGVYRPAGSGGSRDATFALVSHVALYGGFAGDETTLTARDPRAHPTILDGDLAGDDGPDFTNRQDNVYQVVVGVDVHGALLDGFTIQGGHADGPSLGPTPASRDQGSGINLYHGSITVRDCVLRENWAINHGAVNDHSDGSIFDGCLFESNTSAQFGAGLYLHHEAATLAIGCTFRGNQAATDGAGMYVRAHHGARIEDCLFEDNSAERGGGLYAAPASAVHVVDCVFRGNRAVIGGGGHYADEAFTLLEACLFVDNEAGTNLDGGGGGGGGSGGGGVWTNNGGVIVIQVVFRENRASFGGGLYAIHDAHALVSDCVFESNEAEEAGGLYSLNSPVLVLDSRFHGNTASGGAFSVGGGMSHYFSDSWVEGCTLVGNSAELGGGGLYQEGEHPVVRASSFVGNRSLGANGFGGGILTSFFAQALVEDCAFIGNAARFGGGTYDLAFSAARVVNCTYVANAALDGGGIFVGNLATPRFSNCLVHDCGPAAIAGAAADFTFGLADRPQPGLGNVAAVPRFVRAPGAGADGTWGTADDDAGDLGLRAGSPGIDAGDNHARSRQGALDLAGAVRFVDDPDVADTGLGAAPIVDIGARERQP